MGGLELPYLFKKEMRILKSKIQAIKRKPLQVTLTMSGRLRETLLPSKWFTPLTFVAVPAALPPAS